MDSPVLQLPKKDYLYLQESTMPSILHHEILANSIKERNSACKRKPVLTVADTWFTGGVVISIMPIICNTAYDPDKIRKQTGTRSNRSASVKYLKKGVVIIIMPIICNTAYDSDRIRKQTGTWSSKSESVKYLLKETK